jgi:GNAT superfamily N-acetyltransferase
MRTSVLELFRSFYDQRQTASAAVHIAHLDMQLIEDRTYFVHEADAEIVACGGWSRRNKLYTGSGTDKDDARLLDPSNEPARVRAMFVRRDWTRQGLGRAILEACAGRGARGGIPEAHAGGNTARRAVLSIVWVREVGRFTVTMPTAYQSHASR